MPKVAPPLFCKGTVVGDTGPIQFSADFPNLAGKLAAEPENGHFGASWVRRRLTPPPSLRQRGGGGSHGATPHPFLPASFPIWPGSGSRGLKFYFWAPSKNCPPPSLAKRRWWGIRDRRSPGSLPQSISPAELSIQTRKLVGGGSGNGISSFWHSEGVIYSISSGFFF